MVLVRSKVVSLLVQGAALCAGILLYAFLQQIYAQWSAALALVERSSAGARLGLLAGVGLELALLGLLLVLPFSPKWRAEVQEMLGVHLSPSWVYLLVWGAGSVAYHLAVVSPHVLAGQFIWADHDRPLAAFLLAELFPSASLAVWHLVRHDAVSRSARQARHAAGTSMPGSGHAEQARTSAEESPAPEPLDEEVKLRERVEALQREAELAERQWAAAVLQERATRIQAERFAREFAEARRRMEAEAVAQEIPLTMSWEEALRVLRLAPGCTLQEVKDAYRRRVTSYHPDRMSLFGSQIRETAERETKRLNLAYEVAKKKFNG